MKARSLMHPPTCTLPETMGVAAAARLLADAHETAAPVVDDVGHLIGVALRVELEDAVVATQSASARIRGGVVGDVMRTPVVSLTAGAGEWTVAAMLTNPADPFVTVVDGAALVGVIERADLERRATSSAGRLPFPYAKRHSGCPSVGVSRTGA